MNTPNYEPQFYKGKFYLIKWDTSQAVGFNDAEACQDAANWCNAQIPAIAAGWYAGLALVQNLVKSEKN